MFGQNPDLKTWAIKMEISEKLNMGNRLKSLSEHVVTLASCPMLWHKLNQPNENCWMKNTWCYKDLLILLYFCNFRRPWSTKIVQEEIKWIEVVIFSVSWGFLCSECSSMEQSFLIVCLCVLRRFLCFGVRCCVCLTFPIKCPVHLWLLLVWSYWGPLWLWVKSTV